MGSASRHTAALVRSALRGLGSFTMNGFASLSAILCGADPSLFASSPTARARMSSAAFDLEVARGLREIEAYVAGHRAGDPGPPAESAR